MVTTAILLVWEWGTVKVSWYPARILILDLSSGLLSNDIKKNPVFPLYITNLFLLFAYLCKALCYSLTKFIGTLRIFLGPFLVLSSFLLEKETTFCPFLTHFDNGTLGFDYYDHFSVWISLQSIKYSWLLFLDDGLTAMWHRISCLSELDSGCLIYLA